MENKILNIENISDLVRPLAKKYKVREIYVFGSYARGEATENSDVDFLVFGGDDFKLTNILALGEELREALNKDVDVFEICEINQGSNFYKSVMKDKVLVA
ncbi:MAG: nucleotidyltransferase domain-containing protein [Selenomonadaceae bacterium]|nr:nucleotidyltransferase domain-containing protein [Selenomonadaceae bacterium]